MERVDNANAAVDAMSRRSFDLIVTDLQMPPGNWGGLQLIEKARKLDKKVPILVASGKGSLAECNKAMRLGANYYIQKENFSEEFADWTASFYSRPYAIGELPSLLGYLHSSFLGENVPYIRARRLIDLFEATVRLLTSIIMAEESSVLGSTPEDYIRSKELQRLTLGVHVSLLFEYLKGRGGTLAKYLDIQGLISLRRDFDELTASRNNSFGHSATLSPMQAGDFTQTGYPKIVRILNGLGSMRVLELIFVDTLKYDGAGYTIQGKSLKGEHLHPWSASRGSLGPASSNHVIIHNGVTVTHDLDPFVQIEFNQNEQLYVYALYDQLTDRGWKLWTIPRP
jgi:CheY-like chemotaxis protein